MAENQSNLRINIDGSGATSGAADVNRALGMVEQTADRTFRNSTQSANRFTQVLQNLTRNFNFSSAFRRMSQGFSSALTRMKRLFNSFMAGLVNSISSLRSRFINLDLIGGFIKSTTDAGTTVQRFKVVVADILKSNEAAEKSYQFVMDTANRYGVAIQGLLQPYTRLLAANNTAGISLQATERTFKGITAAISTYHLSAQEASFVMLAFTQMISKGKVSMEELRRQLAERIPQAFGLGAESIGKTTSALEDLIRKGGVSGPIFANLLGAKFLDEFGSTAEKVAGTFFGSMNKMTNAWFQFKLWIADSGMLEAFAAIFDDITKKLLANEDAAKKLGKEIGKIVTLTYEWVKSLSPDVVRKFFGDLATAIGMAVKGMVALKDLYDYLFVHNQPKSRGGAALTYNERQRRMEYGSGYRINADQSSSIPATTSTPKRVVGSVFSTASGKSAFDAAKGQLGSAFTSAQGELGSALTDKGLSAFEVKFEQMASSMERSFDRIKFKLQSEIDGSSLSEYQKKIASLSNTIDTQLKSSVDKINLELAKKKITTKEAAAAIEYLKNKASLAKIEINNLVGELEKLDKSPLHGIKSGIRSFYDDANAGAKNWERITTRTLDSMADGLTQFVMTGKMNWRSMIDSMISDLIRLQMRKMVAGLVSDFAGSGFFADIGKAIFGGGKSAGGNVYQGTSYIVGENGPERFVPSTNGAILPNGSGGGGSGVVINVINNSQAKVSAESESDGRGGTSIEILVDEIVAQNLSQYNSGSNRALRNQFGAKPQLVSR